MKKIIVLVCVFILLGLASWGGTCYVQRLKINAQEKHALTVMQTKFKNFVTDWKVDKVPSLYIENAEITNIAKLLKRIQEVVGVCELKKVSYCESQEKYKNIQEDKYKSANGYSVRCPFILSCTKKQIVSGEAVFYPDNTLTKFVSFVLSYEK
ncbi:MAG: hypothetical protein IJY58_04495 [Alphaproteobacteria bacterium]|nr:hypothetical protein [Alphaproteobacteria bacterium]